MQTTLAPWQRQWRERISPVLSTLQLEKLAEGLEANDPALCQKSTCLSDGGPGDPWQAKPAAGCALAYAAWKADPDKLRTVCEVVAAFRDIVAEVGIGFGSFLRFFDGNPRAEVFPALLAEVRRTLEERKANAP